MRLGVREAFSTWVAQEFGDVEIWTTSWRSTAVSPVVPSSPAPPWVIGSHAALDRTRPNSLVPPWNPAHGGRRAVVEFDVPALVLTVSYEPRSLGTSTHPESFSDLAIGATSRRDHGVRPPCLPSVLLACLASIACGPSPAGHDASITKLDGGNAPEDTGVGDNTGPTETIPFAVGENVLPVHVDPGPAAVGYVNGLFASATLCIPGTNECQTIDHLLVDTGSVGVRVLEAALSLNLPARTTASGAGLAECAQFVDGAAWGPLRVADLKLASGTASSVTIQTIGRGYYDVPFDCTGMPIVDAEALGACGVLGVGLFRNDCGAPCTAPPYSMANPGIYYECPSSSRNCQVTDVPLAWQMSHPVAQFSQDNNGLIIQLPEVADSGAPSVQGALILGIGTRNNNGLENATVLTTDSLGLISAIYPTGGAEYPAYLDTGSNAVYFLNQVLSGLPTCRGSDSPFYCPSLSQTITAALSGLNGLNLNVSFSVANASTLFANPTSFAYGNLAGPIPSFSSGAGMPGFVLGLSFHFGRRIFIGVENQVSPGGVGPFLAL